MCNLSTIQQVTALRSLFTSMALMLLAGSMRAEDKPHSDESVRFFELRIRPLLAEHCYRCHGPKRQRGGIRLDSRKGALGNRDGEPIVKPGRPLKSLLFRAVLHTGSPKMPPTKKLPQRAIDDLKTWIELGAPFPDSALVKQPSNRREHWAFKSVRRPSVPKTKSTEWIRDPVDAFVLARLEEKQLVPSPDADRRKLIRRLYFDLIGLPPTPEAIDRFLGDSLPGAYGRLVDRLLASPRYGERWARHWLDVARFADTKGYVLFEEKAYPWAHTYRDYVIEAFNADLPYQQFVREQIAADLLPRTDDRSLRALGFLTLGSRFLNNVHDITDDRIDVVTRGLLGLTVSCARCHDHKFDPIPTTDYYALYGVFASCTEPEVPPLYEPPPQTETYRKFDAELRKREKVMTDFVRKKHTELVEGAKKRVAEYLMAAQKHRGQPSTEQFMLLADTKDLNPTMIVRWKAYLEKHSRHHHPVLAPWEALTALSKDELKNQAPAVLKKLAKESKERPINRLLLDALQSGPIRSLEDVANRYAMALLAIEKKWQALDPNPLRLEDPAEEQLRLVFYGSDAPPNVAFLPYGSLSLLPDRASQAVLRKHRKALEEWRAKGPGAPPRAMTLTDKKRPYAPYVFRRGNPNNRGINVRRRLPGVLQSLHRGPFQYGSGRRELAEAIAHSDNPLTHRVIVNRVWQHHFGEGLVRTPNDFGARGEAPTHPGLLEWLTADFLDHGGSIKHLHRRIVLSSTYRQGSERRPESIAIDPGNRLLSSKPRRRLDFEAIRDTLISVAGRLGTELGGPSETKPLSSGATRRSLYNFVDRENVPVLFRTFDFPSPDASSGKRPHTTTALQALFLMNHPFVMDSARSVLQRPDLPEEPGARIRYLYKLLFARLPSPEEMALARRFLDSEGNSGTAWERYIHALIQTNELVWID